MNESVGMAARSAVARQEQVGIDKLCVVRYGFPRLTSAVTAVFDVRVTDGHAVWTVPVAVKVEYSHPVAIT